MDVGPQFEGILEGFGCLVVQVRLNLIIRLTVREYEIHIRPRHDLLCRIDTNASRAGGIS